MNKAEPMTATEHAQAIAKACGMSPLNFACLSDRILAAVEAAMQDARAEAIAECAAVADSRADFYRRKELDNLGLKNLGRAGDFESMRASAFMLAVDIAALAHKGAGDE